MASKLIVIIALAASAAARPSNITSERGKLNGNADQNNTLILDDMRFVEGQLEQVKSGAGIPGDQYRWPGAVVPYTLDASIGIYSASIVMAMEEFRRNTCIKFVPRTSEQNYITIFAGEGCYSHVGMTGGQQPLSLGYNCMAHGTIVHELGHALGFGHEQSRSDRDQFLTINWENILKGWESQFSKLQPSQNILFTPFDYNSIMIYGNRAFSKDGRSMTMVAKDGGPLVNPEYKSGMTTRDVIAIKKMYQCP